MTHPRALYPKLLQPVDKYRALVLGDLAMSHLPTGEVEESVRLTDSAFKSAALGRPYNSASLPHGVVNGAGGCRRCHPDACQSAALRDTIVRWLSGDEAAPRRRRRW